MACRPHFGLNVEYGVHLKGWFYTIEQGCKAHNPLTAHAIGGFSDPGQTILWV